MRNNIAINLARRIAWLKTLREKQELMETYNDLTPDEMALEDAFEWHLDDILGNIKKEDWHA